MTRKSIARLARRSETMREAELEAGIARLFEGAGVAVAAERNGGHPLFPEESIAVANAVPSRREELAAGRAAARRALSRLGIDAVPIPSGERRAPIWPAGVIGSITHSGGFAAAAVARAGELIAIGLDIEVASPLPPDVAALVVRADDHLGAGPLGTVVAFSAKESVYKALFPLLGWVLEFGDVALQLGADGTLTARATTRGTSRVVHGRWLVLEGFVATAVVVP